MTKKKLDKPKKKRHNITRHDRAMADTKVKADFCALKSGWPSLSEQDRGDQVRKLEDSGCTVRGLGRDLGQPPTTLSRYMKLAETAEANKDWSAMLDTVAPRESRSRNTLSSIEAARESKAEFQRTKAMRLANAQKDQVSEVQPASKAKPTIASRVTPISAKESPVVNDGSDGKENRRRRYIREELA